MFCSRDIIRRLSGILLVLTFLFGIGVENFHRHPSAPVQVEECQDCASGHHSGHLYTLHGELHECLVCRTAALPFVESCGPEEVPAVSAVLFFFEDVTESVPSSYSFSFSSRAPPVHLS